MNKQTIQELEIIVRAKVDQAKKEIRQVSQDTKKMATEVSSSINKMNNNKQLDGFKNSLKQVRTSVERMKNEFKTGMYMNIKINKEQLNKDIETYKSIVNSELSKIGLQNVDFGFDKQGNIEIAKDKVNLLKTAIINMTDASRTKLETLETSIKTISQDLNAVETSKIAQLGNFFERVKNKVQELATNIKKSGNEAKKAEKNFNLFGNTLSKSFDKGIKSIKKFALALISVRSIFSLVSKASQAYLSFDNQLNDSMQNAWNTLGSLLAPALEFVIGLFNKATSAVAQLVKALSGVDLVARANTKALNSQAKAASNTAKSLSSIDDISVLSTSSGGGSDTTSQQIEVQDVDISPIVKFVEKAKQLFSTIIEPFKNAWDNYGKEIIENLIGYLNNINQFILDIADSLLKWVVSPGFQKAIDLVLEVIKDILGWMKEISSWILKMYEQYIKPVIDEKVIPLFESIVDLIKLIWDVANPVINKIISTIEKYLEPIIEGLMQSIGGIIDILRGIINFIVGVFTGNWRKAFEALKTIVSGVFNGIWGIIRGILNLIITGFESMVNTVIKGLNALLSPLRKLGNAILDLIGVNVSIPTISKVSLPRLATGTVAYEPLVAQIGEYANAKTNPEIVSPVSMMKEAFRDVLNENDGGGTRFDKLVINVAGDNFYQGAVDYINNENARKGVNIIKEM